MKSKVSLLHSTLIALVLLALAQTASAQSLQDDALRANYLVRFVDFVRWENPTNEPVSIGVMGSPSLYKELLKVAADKKEKGREFAIYEYSANDDMARFDLIYIASGLQAQWPRFLDEAKKQSVVTVSDQAGFLDAGGLIEFMVQRNRLRFVLNLELTEDYRVGLSSKLIQLSARP